jgi:CRISPR/Cas system-associated exonuclease Cas4 (RecB family)
VISGRVDDLLLIRESGKNILVEVKSCKNIEYVKSPQNHHIMQLQFYMFATGVHDGVLLYVDKTTLLTRMFGFRFDENLSKKIIARFKKLHAYLTEDAIPEPEARQVENLGWMCKYCEYKERCDNDKNI